MKKSIILVILLLTVLCGCTNATVITNPSLWTEDELYLQLFNLENKVEIDINMSEEELAKLQADYEAYSSRGSKSPIYRMADVTITLTTPDGGTGRYYFPQVGVRMKGNTSRASFYSSEEGIYNHIHLKLDFQETFDNLAYYGADAVQWSAEAKEIRQKRTFATLKKMDLRWNKCEDSTYLRELYAYEIYRDQGVPAPRMNLSSLTWSGNQMGIYSINEPVDKRFLEKRLPAEALGGDLYKCGWGNQGGATFNWLGSIGVENEDTGEFYAYDLKTNKSTSNHSALKNLILNLNDGSVTRDELDQLVDMENFLNFSAVSWLIGNPDDLRNNYNNFYMYFRADNGKMILIPYDADRCLGITAQWNPSGNGCTTDDPFSANRTAVDARGKDADRGQINPLILYTVVKGGYYTEEYAQRLHALGESGWVSEATFASYYKIAEALYADAAFPSKAFRNSLGDGYRFDMETPSQNSPSGNLSFREYITEKLNTLEHFLSDSGYRTGNPPSIPVNYYIRADFTDWQIDPAWIMNAENGKFTTSLTCQNEVRLKIYDKNTGHWFGSECLEPDSISRCETDGHTNLVFAPGSYVICFDPMTGLIEITGA